ncbi:alpha/beta hydrolase family protein [Zavarzinia sp. CC-PAN008]|uniref:alpha/beta hydrolase family protein n=1 Tax=Zavarzinia sp. CC-PAN008 TaxID=3243332 RepID=UPI003F74A68D
MDRTTPGTPATLVAQPIRFPAADGLELGGFVWHQEGGGQRPVAVITAATSVRCRYYARFAEALFAAGWDVLTFDYRGIGESRPASLRGFKADWPDWGELDLEGALRHVLERFPGQPLDIVAHSIGGFQVGCAPSTRLARRIVTVGAQFAHWRDYAPGQRRGMVAKWHIAMPLLVRIFGYMPAKRLGWMEDTPAGVALDWARMRPRFEDTVQRGDRLRATFSTVRAPILAIGLDDDPYGTVAAIERLLAYFDGAERTHLRVAPADLGVPQIGHFAFFHTRFQATLWPLALAWLRDGDLPSGAPGRIQGRMPPAQVPAIGSSAP